uniref:DNA topoisomerase n=1 Tax=Chenopodium quinoa TaxID=63459 RepID=A0A803L4R8_CHEQI
MAGNRQIRALNVAEKPSVAKAVAGILSRNQLRVREGRSRYNKIFEFDYTIRGQPIHMLFTSVTGHLMELEFDQRYRKWHSCDPSDLYQAPVHKTVPQDKLDIKRTLQQEARGCQWLILWLDCDREGENIAFEVIEVCAEANPNLNTWRARFSALIDRDIHEAVQNLVRPNQSFAEAVDARQVLFSLLLQEIDLRIGASFTRFQTMLLKDAFNFNIATEDRSLVLSYGPCQVVPPVAVLTHPYSIGHLACIGKYKHMNRKSFGLSIVLTTQRKELQISVGCVAICLTIPVQSSSMRCVLRNQLLLWQKSYTNLVSLAILEPRLTLSRLGLICMLAIVQEQQAHPVWGTYAQRLLDPEADLWKNPGSGGHDDKAHPPIHPTKFSAGESGWSQDHNNVYELVVRHFLACVSQPAVSAETTVEIDIAGEMFSASGRVILAKNYLDVYRFESWGGSMIPTYMFGQQFTPTTLTLDSGVTRPPPLLSEADLLSCMDKAGIGTDATMHDHIKKLLDRFYATKDANTRFSPTNLMVWGKQIGNWFPQQTLRKAVIKIMLGYLFGTDTRATYNDIYELWKPYLRSKMEDDMRAVSLGTKRKAEILASCLQEMKACFLDARVNKVKLFEAMEIFFDRTNRSGAEEQQTIGGVVRRCGLCQQADMALKRKPDGKFMVSCLAFPLCRNVVWLPGSISEATVTSNICNLCSPGCVGGCDDTLRQLTEICGTGPHNLSGTSAAVRGQTPTTTSARNMASNVQRGVCSHCGQTGHSSNDCPSQVSTSGRARSRATNHTDGMALSKLPSKIWFVGVSYAALFSCKFLFQNVVDLFLLKYNVVVKASYPALCIHFNVFLLPEIRWEDMVDGGGGVQNALHTNGRGANATTARRGGRGRGRRGGGRGSDTTFVSATGEPVSGRRCFTCGDPSHFANSCPNRGI